MSAVIYTNRGRQEDEAKGVLNNGRSYFMPYAEKQGCAYVRVEGGAEYPAEGERASPPLYTVSAVRLGVPSFQIGCFQKSRSAAQKGAMSRTYCKVQQQGGAPLTRAVRPMPTLPAQRYLCGSEVSGCSAGSLSPNLAVCHQLSKRTLNRTGA